MDRKEADRKVAAAVAFEMGLSSKRLAVEPYWPNHPKGDRVQWAEARERLFAELCGRAGVDPKSPEVRKDLADVIMGDDLKGLGG